MSEPTIHFPSGEKLIEQTRFNSSERSLLLCHALWRRVAESLAVLKSYSSMVPSGNGFSLGSSPVRVEGALLPTASTWPSGENARLQTSSLLPRLKTFMGFAGKQAPQDSDKHASIAMILIELSDLCVFILDLCRAPVMAAFLGMAFKGLGTHSRCQHSVRANSEWLAR
jgi:hypothetical protein